MQNYQTYQKFDSLLGRLTSTGKPFTKKKPRLSSPTQVSISIPLQSMTTSHKNEGLETTKDAQRSLLEKALTLNFNDLAKASRPQPSSQLSSRNSSKQVLSTGIIKSNSRQLQRSRQNTQSKTHHSQHSVNLNQNRVSNYSNSGISKASYLTNPSSNYTHSSEIQGYHQSVPKIGQSLNTNRTKYNSKVDKQSSKNGGKQSLIFFERFNQVIREDRSFSPTNADFIPFQMTAETPNQNNKKIYDMDQDNSIQGPQRFNLRQPSRSNIKSCNIVLFDISSNNKSNSKTNGKLEKRLSHNQSYEIEDQIEQMRAIQELSYQQLDQPFESRTLRLTKKIQRWYKQILHKRKAIKAKKYLKANLGRYILGHRVRKAFKWLQKQQIGKEAIDLLRIKNDVIIFTQKSNLSGNNTLSQAQNASNDPFIQNITKQLRIKLQEFNQQLTLQLINLKKGKKLEIQSLKDQLVLLNKRLNLKRQKSNERGASENSRIIQNSLIQNNLGDQNQQTIKNKLRVLFQRVENIILSNRKDSSDVLDDCLENIKELYENEKRKRSIIQNEDSIRTLL
ncbi:UNKNOWN [Stylonychia lemnae]|uniref:Uncharacterized protein n=1 Tax=Stylonychia lemnae TaxID=5949 RepID=A0A078B3U0_STYLE|nr:UNKNOWN [Stylonychia lemnae]|eukprot:CDW88178.1 UNKNOWN [Stylonychia lemnae]